MGFITVGFLAALLLNIVNIDSGLITSFTTSIISIDVALLFSNIVSRQKNYDVRIELMFYKRTEALVSTILI